MAEYIIQDSTLTDIADAIRAKDGSSAPILTEDMADAIAAIPSGTTITDGMIVTQRETSSLERALKIIHFGARVFNNQYASETNDGYKYYTTNEIIFHDAITEIGDNAFYSFGRQASPSLKLEIPQTVTKIGKTAFRSSGVVVVEFPVAVTSIGMWTFCDANRCTTIRLPGVTSLPGTDSSSSAITGTLGSLSSVEVGSIGHTVTSCGTYAINCQNSGLVVTIYTNGSYLDTILTNVRTRATNATIIIKASEATTYNGTSYAAGDTILTSEVA